MGKWYALLLCVALLVSTSTAKDGKLAPEKLGEADTVIVPTKQWATEDTLTAIHRGSDLFTQGLAYLPTNKGFVENTGLYRKSRLRMYDAGYNLLSERSWPSSVFGEGVCIVHCSHDDHTYALSLDWISQRGQVTDPEDMEIRAFVTDVDSMLTSPQWDGRPFYREFRFPGIVQGWGVTNFGENTVVVSDGTHELSVYDVSDVIERGPRRTRSKPRATLLWRASISTRRNGESKVLRRLNELEFFQDKREHGALFNGLPVIFANIWHSSYIAVISVPKDLPTRDPETNNVPLTVGCLLDASDLVSDAVSGLRDSREAVLNGVAIVPDEEDGFRFYFTGKLWNRIYHLPLNVLDDACNNQ